MRRDLEIFDGISIVPGAFLWLLRPPAMQRLNRLFPHFIAEHNPFFRRIIRRTCYQLENQVNPTIQEPMLKRIEIELLGEAERDAIPHDVKSISHSSKNLCDQKVC